MRDRILKKLIRDIEKTSILNVSNKIKVPYATLHRIANNKGSENGNIRTWDKIEHYYNKTGRGAQ